MTANILTAKRMAESIKNSLRNKRGSFSKITLASCVVGDNEAVRSYCISQKRWADALGVEYKEVVMDKRISEKEAIDIIEDLSNDASVNGIVLHKPFLKGWNEHLLFESVKREKDIEGLNPYNLGELFFGNSLFIPPTVLSVLELLKSISINLYGKNVVIVGFSNILGKPLGIILADKFATVSITHIGTFEANKLPFYLRNADIVITAVGKPRLIKGQWIKDGAVVIDVGIAKLSNKITGDVEFEEALKHVSYITPVPGGVGALTVAFLFSNLFRAAQMQKR